MGLALSFANIQVDAEDEWHIALYDEDTLGGSYETESHQLNNEACSIVVMGSGKRLWAMKQADWGVMAQTADDEWDP